MNFTTAATASPVKSATLKSRWLAAVAGVLLALLTGLLIVLSFPPFGLWPLIFVAFVPMILAQHRVLPAGISGLAPGIGIACMFAHAISGGLADGRVALVYQLWPAYVAIIISLLAWRSRRFHERTGYRWFLISFPCAWVAIDFLRAWSGVDFLGGTWGNPAYALFGQAWFLQPLSIVGIFGLQLLLLVVNFAVAAAAMAIADGRANPRVARQAAARKIALAAGILLLWGLLSLVLYQQPEGGVRVAAVQPNAVLNPEEEFRRDIRMTREAAARGAKLVVWRENGLKFDPRREHTQELVALAADTDTTIAMGYGYESEKGHHNEAVVLTPDGRFFGPYGKTHPGRFAGDFSDTGGRYEVYDTPVGPLATIICYDLDFTDSARRMVQLGARIIAVPSADVPAIARSHYTHLVFRAIENRVGMVKADNSFDSAIIDPFGRIKALELNAWSVEQARANAHGEVEAGLIVADIPLGEGNSIYNRLGDWVGYVAVLLMLFFVVLSFRSRRYPAKV